MRAIENIYKSSAAIFKALGDETRVHILYMLQLGEKTASELLVRLDVSQPTLSHHLSLLSSANLIEARKDGRWIYYSLCRDGTDRAKELLKETVRMNSVEIIIREEKPIEKDEKAAKNEPLKKTKKAIESYLL